MPYRLVALLAALTAVLVAGWLAVDLGGPLLSATVDHAAQAAAALCAGVACFYASRREPSGMGRAWTQALRRGWRLIAAAAVIWGIAKLVWTYEALALQQQAPVTQADAGYLVAIPLLVTGMLAFPIAVGQPAARIRTLLDALIIAASLLAVSWVTTISPLLHPPNQGSAPPVTLLQQAIALAQPIFDILVATVALSLLARTRGRDPAPMTMLCLALLALAVASSGYVHLVATARYGTHHLIDIGRVVGWLLILVAALRPMAAHVERQNERQSLARITLPYALLALAILTVITVRLSTAQLNRFLFLDSIVLAALVIARQLVTLIENRQLNRRLERMVEELSEREAQLERALSREQQAAERLRAADSMKDTFLRAVSHDLRNPLTAILGVALTLERTKLQLPREKAMELLGMLVEKARKLDRLLADLLDLNRLEQGILEPNRSHTDIGVMIRHLVDEVDHLEGRPVYVDVPVLVADIDGPKVERILENLLINTTRHTPAGTPVWVRGMVRGRDLELVVEDAGPGVPPELAGSIFEPFRQGPNAAKKSSGVGIGLSLVARFAQLHGGSAWVGERYGGGAAFHVLLPNAVVQNGHAGAPPAVSPARQPGRQPASPAEIAQRSGAPR
ncbi:MAG TPA: ATP-binding protein [Actinomycetes bacterium]